MQFKSVWDEPQVGKCKTIEISFEPKGKPKRFKARPLSNVLLQEAHKQVDTLLAAGVVEPSAGNEWGSPIHMVPKKAAEGLTKWRMTIDYRYLNNLIADSHYPLPVISTIYSKLHQKRYFSSIDLNWGFWNVKLNPNCWKYTAFVVPERGLFIWKVLPFGLKIAPTDFQCAVEKALGSLLLSGCVFLYIDDIIIATISIREHLYYLRRVLECLHREGLFINLSKVKILQEEILYLGSMISLNKVRPDPKKVQGIVAAQPPRDRTELRSFLGRAGYLRAFIPNFSEIARPLSLLTSKYATFEWSKEQSESFETLKTLISGGVFVSIPDPALPFVIYSDASNIGCGAALCQKPNDSDISYIAFASKSFNETQSRWDTGEREAYAIVWSCETFQQYIKGQHTIVYTDHKNFTWPSTFNNAKVLRWALRLQEFHITLKYIPGEENVVADWLSRSNPSDDILHEYSLVPLCSSAMLELNTPKMPTQDELNTETRLEFPGPCPDVTWTDGTPYYRRSGKLYVPLKYRTLLIWWHHASPYGGHQGANRTTKRITRHFGWPHLPRDVEAFIQRCILCNCLRRKTKPNAGEPGALDRPVTFQTISCDVIGPYKIRNQPTYAIHVIVDHCSRFM